MHGLCRDCNISPADRDNIYISSGLKCDYITIHDIVGKTKEHTESFSFIPINNCFTHLSFGGYPRSIYGGTPAEIVHTVLLGLCEYIIESMELKFTLSAIDMISHVVVGIYKDSRRQSEHDLPDLDPFRNGLTSIKSLKDKEIFLEYIVCS